MARVTDLLLPPGVTEQLEWEDNPYWCEGHDKHHVERRLAPRQVVALPETLTVPCPNCSGWAQVCSVCGTGGRVPLPDGIYQLMTGALRTWYFDKDPEPLGSPVRVTRFDWEKCVTGVVDIHGAPFMVERYMTNPPRVAGLHLSADVYDRLAARPHGGGVLLVEAT